MHSHRLQAGVKICKSNSLSKYRIFSDIMIQKIVAKLNLHGKIQKT